MKRKRILIGLGVAVAAAGWYAFRPERLWVDSVVNESFAAGSVSSATGAASGAAVAVASGRFHSVAHDGVGTATIYRLPDGKRVLRLTEFATSNGPELYLYLIAAGDANDNETVKRAGFVSLGPLKGNQGHQNYEIPADVNLAKYRAVTVWCRRFSVNFTTAPLAAEGGAAATSSSASVAPAPILSGRFHSNAHETAGTATVYRLGDGRRVLRLTEFATSNGPDVRVYLVAASDVTDNETVKKAGFVELGKLKGNRGDQNYDIPADLDLAKYRAVTIWCRRFSVNFGTAPLADTRS
jgi:hypothetical protein